MLGPRLELSGNATPSPITVIKLTKRSCNRFPRQHLRSTLRNRCCCKHQAEDIYDFPKQKQQADNVHRFVVMKLTKARI